MTPSTWLEIPEAPPRRAAQPVVAPRDAPAAAARVRRAALVDRVHDRRGVRRRGRRGAHDHRDREPVALRTHRAPDGAVRVLGRASDRAGAAHHRQPLRVHAGRVPDVALPLRRARARSATRRVVLLARAHGPRDAEAPVRRRARAVRAGGVDPRTASTGAAHRDRRRCRRVDPARRPRRRLGLRRGEQRDARHRGCRRRHLRPAQRARAPRQPVGGRGAGRAGQHPERGRSVSRLPAGGQGEHLHQRGRRCARQLPVDGTGQEGVGVVLRCVGALRRRPARRSHHPVGVRPPGRDRWHPGGGAQLRPARRRHVAGARAVPTVGGVGAEARPGGLLRRVQRPRVADEPRPQSGADQRVRPVGGSTDATPVRTVSTPPATP